MLKQSRLIFIVGYGRSGSTILDLLLGNSKKVAALGEVAYLTDAVWTSNHYCSCGKSASECEYWSAFKTKWELNSEITIESFLALEKRYSRLSGVTRLFFDKSIDSKSFNTYRKTVSNLYNILLELNDGSIAIDASKLPFRLLILRVLGFRPFVIHLVRDGRAVLGSLKKGHRANLEKGVQKALKPKPTIRVALGWGLANVFSELFSFGLNRILLRYEDLVTDPIFSLKRIESGAEIELHESKEIIVKNLPFIKRHTITGNRLRMSNEIRMVKIPDESWKKSLAVKDAKLFYILTMLLLKRYNYLK
ncbi:sulfotransferase [Imperialibacter roseus]|uniref:Sulfotransferase n=1 Tax=Imperialibacter roseus TaxID=1324217 RepID=A0ABZ0IML1_9BACT|nr:sulfotransferase [Imperialibacter roseus]WOK06273.1 sulfotransferase [Imperialibacter roseus]